MASDVAIRPISFARRRERNRFISVPFGLYPPESPWISPPRLAVARLLNPSKNPFFAHTEMVGFLALREGRPVGRIAAIVNENHNRFHDERTGFFGFFESVDDRAVAHALFDAAAAWLRERGMETMRGPANPSTNDDCGLLIDAFDLPPVIMMPYNPPYYVDLVESYGFRKAKDLYAYQMFAERGMSKRVVRLAEAIRRRTRATIRPIDLKNLDAELEIVRSIYKSAWEKNWGFVPMTEEEIAFAADDLKEAADPDCTLFAEVDGEAVGFCVTLLDLNQVFAKLRNGRLFPFGIWTYLRGKRKIDAVRVLLLGVRPEYRGRGIDVLFYHHVYETGTGKGYTRGEFSWILEDNVPMNEAIRKMGGEHYKTYRMYDLPL